MAQSTTRVLLLLGAGPKIGQYVSQAAIAKGYKVALVSRKRDKSNDSNEQISISADLSSPDAVIDVFSKVKSLFGPPSLVIYNAAAHNGGEKENPLGIAASDLARSLNVNTVSAYVAAQEAVKGFAELPASAARTFIYTGNFLNTNPMASLLHLGIGKSATAHFIHVASEAYADRGFKFYYADERKEDGTPMWKGTGGPAAAEHYLQLAEDPKQGPWLQTFVEGSGYKDFSVSKI